MANETISRPAPYYNVKPIKIRVLKDIPVYQYLQPVVGKIYDAFQPTRKLQGPPFCYVEISGKKVVLRTASLHDNTGPEYEEVLV